MLILQIPWVIWNEILDILMSFIPRPIWNHIWRDVIQSGSSELASSIDTSLRVILSLFLASIMALIAWSL
jgi:hypothetical protein